MNGAIEYAQARIQARHGARAPPGAWATLHAATSLAALLENARASALEPWTAGLEADSTPDQLELVLRERLREAIARVATWMPEPWRAAILWTRVLIDLPAMQHVLWGRAPERWMARDPEIAPRLAEPADDERAAALRRWWLQTWRRLWPRCGPDDRAGLEELIDAVEAHIRAFRSATPDEAAGLRQALQSRLEILFRRHALTPACAFAHLALLALDAEHLRAELVTRAAS